MSQCASDSNPDDARYPPQWWLDMTPEERDRFEESQKRHLEIEGRADDREAAHRALMQSVICPTCGSLPGQVCVKKSGWGSAPTHKPRARLARLTERHARDE